jgi:hypothetical protein
MGHKHAEVLRAIADGKKVQIQLVGESADQDTWVDIQTRPSLCLYHERTYRVKPEEKHETI